MKMHDFFTKSLERFVSCGEPGIVSELSFFEFGIMNVFGEATDGGHQPRLLLRTQVRLGIVGIVGDPIVQGT